MDKKQARKIRRCYYKSGQPKRCTQCLSPDLVEDVRDSLDVGVGIGIPMEIAVSCNKCGAAAGYWAHGYWDSCYLMGRLGVEY